MIALLAATDAWARLGGGEGWGGGGGGGGGGGEHGIGFDGDGGEIWLLIQLVRFAIEVPQIGVPMLVVVAGFVVVRMANASQSSAWRHERRGTLYSGPRKPQGGRAPVAHSLPDDPGFSPVVLLDLASLVHRRALEAARSGDADALAPWLSAEAFATLRSGPCAAAEAVMVGGAAISALRREGARHVARIAIDTSWQRGGRHERAQLRWTLVRPASVRSVEPAKMTALSCPSCASPIQTDRMGRCASCGTAIARGEATWRAVAVAIDGPRAAPGPDVSRTGGEEAGFRAPLVTAPDLGPAWRRLAARSPDATEEHLVRRVSDVFERAQAAWSSGRLAAVRPYVTDALYQRLRFLLEPWAAAGLRNELRALRLLRVEPVAVGRDAWYDTVSLRIWAECVDVVVDTRGEVVSGDATVARRFSEVWTLLRTVGGRPMTGADPDQCPSCAAPIAEVGETGVCAHCDAVVTSGAWDWVLSRIDQADAWAGGGG